MQKKLTKLQAFNAVGRLLQMYFDHKPSGDLATILSNMSFLNNNEMIDNIMWDIWINSLDRIFRHKNLRNYKKITLREAFLAMGVYLEDFFGFDDLDEDIIFLEQQIRIFREKKTIDPVLWKRWLQCVDEVLSVKDSRAYFYLLPKN